MAVTCASLSATSLMSECSRFSGVVIASVLVSVMKVAMDTESSVSYGGVSEGVCVKCEGVSVGGS